MGGRCEKARRESDEPRRSVSSSCTIFTTCWPGVRLFCTSSPSARSRTRGDELLDDAEVDVGLEQREAHLAHGAGERLLVEDTAPAEVAEGALELVAERVEHRPPGYPDGL